MTDIAKEYGAALFLLAKEEGKADDYARDLELVRGVFEENPAYAVLLSSPNIAKKERASLLEDAFGDALEGDVLSFLKLLCEKEHILLFNSCKAAYDELLSEDRKVSVATVKSAVPLTDTEKKTLIQKLEALSGRTVDAYYTVDESLLAGVVIEIDDKILDGSLKRQIRNLKEVISQ